MPKVKTEIKQEHSENAPIEYGPHKFGCPFCSQLMYDSGDMKFHIMKHTGEKPFSCNY